MANLKAIFIERYDHSPVSFRAGRYGAGNNTLSICLQLGYRVDTSIVPYTIFREGKILINNASYTVEPFFIENGQQWLLEIPITVMPGLISTPSYVLIGQRLYHDLPPSSKRIVDILIKIIDRIFLPLHKKIWLRPSYSSLNQMKRVLLWLRKQKNIPIVANMMFHSNELIPNASPYNRTEDDVKLFLSKISSIIQYATELGFKFVTLENAADVIRKTVHQASSGMN